MKRLFLIVIATLIITSNIVIQDQEAAVTIDLEDQTRGGNLTMDMNISNISDASFIGEYDFGYVGLSVAGAGDVNGDGYDDILIGGPHNNGRTYLIFGKKTEWSNDFNLSKADASFVGEGVYDRSGHSISGAGDVNGDGYDDILIGAPFNGDSYYRAGKTYLIFGKQMGWQKNIRLSEADASFTGETAGDWSGWSISGAGDVNNDGYADILIGAYKNSESGSFTGQTYLILGNSSGWSTDMKLSEADASFIGEGGYDTSGYSVSDAGDVNRDGFDDIIIGAIGADEGGTDSGKTYLIFGKASNWSTDNDLSEANASYIGEESEDSSGLCLACAGDVNGDGFDDILIGSESNDGGDYRGKTYLIFGKSTGWERDIDLSTVDASFRGIETNDYSGCSLSGHGDVNGDGLDDFLIGAKGGSGSGETYLIFGKASNWTRDMDLSEANASFRGENASDEFGYSVALLGDVDKDGADDILIGAPFNDHRGYDSGKAYLVKGIGVTEPTEISSFEFFSKPYSDPRGFFDIGETVYLELIGRDGDPSHLDSALINITFPDGIRRLPLKETGISTGIFRGYFDIVKKSSYFDIYRLEPRADTSFARNIIVDYPHRPSSVSSVDLYVMEDGIIKATEKVDFNETVHFRIDGSDANPLVIDKAFLNLTSDKNSSLNPMIICDETGENTGTYIGNFTVPKSMIWFENITAASVRDPKVSDMFMIHTPFQIRPLKDKIWTKEDEEYKVRYWNFGYHSVNWEFQTDAEWLEFDGELKGIPRNDDVGTYSVYMNASDNDGNEEHRFFRIEVNNTVPVILTEDQTQVKQGQYYEVDYGCDDEGRGDTRWICDRGDAHWLKYDQYTGILNGTPQQEDVGDYTINMSVDDGNGGINWTEFVLTVIDVNLPPEIETEPITTTLEDDPYLVNFKAVDPDETEISLWEVITDASFLSIDPDTGKLFGMPTNSDVGIHSVRIIAEDPDGLSDLLDYKLEVINVNDDPEWINVPSDTQVDQGEIFTFDVEATDVDMGDEITYSMESDPEIDISIEADTGLIEWNATLDGITPDHDYLVDITLNASDGNVTIFHTFTLKVIPNPTPTSDLVFPEDSELVNAYGIVVKWEGDDDSENIIYNLYLGKDPDDVSNMVESTLEAKEVTQTSYRLSGLDQGEVYYWTVIPSDIYSTGICSDGVQSFTVNTIPKLDILHQWVYVGEEFRLQLEGTDPEVVTESGELLIGLIKGPEGMEFDPSTNTLKWTPTSDQVGNHTVVVFADDGLNPDDEITFNINVKENPSGDEGGDPSLLIVGIAAGSIIVIAVVILGILFLLLRKKKEGSQSGAEAESIQGVDVEDPADDSELTPSGGPTGGSYGNVGSS